MSLLDRTRFVWAAMLGLICGPLITSLGMPSNLLIDWRTCLTGVLLGIAVAYLFESLTDQHSHSALFADVAAINRALHNALAWTVAALRPKRWWFRISLRTWLALTAVASLAVGWIGHNLHRSLKRDELLSRLAQITTRRDRDWYLGLLTGPKLEPHIVVMSDVPQDDLTQMRMAFPESNIWGFTFSPGIGGAAKSKLLVPRSTHAEFANTECWAEGYLE